MDKLTEILLQNFDEYKEKLLQKDKDKIFSKSYEIALKTEITNYDDWNRVLSETIYDMLIRMRHLLDFLYNEYLRSDSANIVNELILVFENLGSWGK